VVVILIEISRFDELGQRSFAIRDDEVRCLKGAKAMIELTEKQSCALDAQNPEPLHLVNPATREVYVLIPKRVYDLTRKMVSGGPGQVWDEADDDLIARDRP
jgi:hypothetical protein